MGQISILILFDINDMKYSEWTTLGQWLVALGILKGHSCFCQTVMMVYDTRILVNGYLNRPSPNFPQLLKDIIEYIYYYVA